jgi:hypothetical protein
MLDWNSVFYKDPLEKNKKGGKLAYKVYLAGGISGLDYKTATDWRKRMIIDLKAIGVEGLDPMRGKAFLEKEGILQADCSHIKEVLSSNKGILTRDHWDCTRGDMLFVNFLGAKEKSLGTAMEIAWAWDHQIPIICAMEDDNIHKHGMILEAINFKVTSIEEGIKVIGAMCGH